MHETESQEKLKRAEIEAQKKLKHIEIEAQAGRNRISRKIETR